MEKLTLKEALKLVYQASEVGYTTTRTLYDICWPILQEIQEKKDLAKLERRIDDEHKHEAYKTIWGLLMTSLSQAVEFYGNKKAKFFFNKIWTMAGYADIDSEVRLFNEAKIVDPITFTEKPTPEILALQDDYEGHDIERIFNDPLLDWVDRYKNIYNVHIADIWRLAGLCFTVDKQLDRTGVDPKILSMWDLAMHGIRSFFYKGQECLATIECSIYNYLNGEDENINLEIRAKYAQKNELSIPSYGGIFFIDEDKLPAEWQAKVTKSPIEMDYV